MENCNCRLAQSPNRENTTGRQVQYPGFAGWPPFPSTGRTRRTKFTLTERSGSRQKIRGGGRLRTRCPVGNGFKRLSQVHGGPSPKTARQTCPGNRRRGSGSVLLTTRLSGAPRTGVGPPPGAAPARTVRGHPSKPSERAPRPRTEPRPALQEGCRPAGPEFHRGPSLSITNSQSSLNSCPSSQ